MILLILYAVCCFIVFLDMTKECYSCVGDEDGEKALPTIIFIFFICMIFSPVYVFLKIEDKYEGGDLF